MFKGWFLGLGGCESRNVATSDGRTVKVRMIAAGNGEYTKHQHAPTLPKEELDTIAQRAAEIMAECRRDPKHRWELIANAMADGFRFLNAASSIENDASIEIEVYQSETQSRDWYVIDRNGKPDIVSVTVGNEPKYWAGKSKYAGPFGSREEASEYARVVRW